MKQSSVVYLFLLLLVVFQSCSEEEKPAVVAQKTARVLITHQSPSARPASNVEFFTSDITLGNNNRKANLAYGAASATNPNAGTVFLKTRYANESAPFLSGQFSTQEYNYYTAIFANADGASTSQEAPTAIALLHDDLTPPSGENAKVRLVHLGVGASEVDIYFYTGDTQGDPLVTAFSYGKVHPGNVSLELVNGEIGEPVESAFITVPIGAYKYAIRPAGAEAESTPLLSGNISLAAGRSYTVIVRGYAAPPDGVTGRNLNVVSLLHERI
jgi:hypothetical protein